jgi:hypothetical protein
MVTASSIEVVVSSRPSDGRIQPTREIHGQSSKVRVCILTTLAELIPPAGSMHIN